MSNTTYSQKWVNAIEKLSVANDFEGFTQLYPEALNAVSEVHALKVLVQHGNIPMVKFALTTSQELTHMDLSAVVHKGAAARQVQATSLVLEWCKTHNIFVPPHPYLFKLAMGAVHGNCVPLLERYWPDIQKMRKEHLNNIYMTAGNCDAVECMEFMRPVLKYADHLHSGMVRQTARLNKSRAMVYLLRNPPEFFNTKREAGDVLLMLIENDRYKSDDALKTVQALFEFVTASEFLQRFKERFKPSVLRAIDELYIGHQKNILQAALKGGNRQVSIVRKM